MTSVAAAPATVRPDILVTGANGTLGQAILRAIGPERAIAVTRGDAAPLEGYRHAQLGANGRIAPHALATSHAHINAAGRVTGTQAELDAANVQLAVDLAEQARDAGVRKFVQVGSFSVYGYAEYVDSDTAVAPATAYGRSKARADTMLFDLTTDEFRVESVRLPFLFSPTQPALLRPLIALGRRIRMLPAGNPPMQRSMITYEDAAAVMLSAAVDDHSGATLAADPQLFDYALLCRVVAEERGQRWRIMTLPAAACTAINRVAPNIGRRLFRSSLLAASANRAGTRPLGLESALRAIIRTMV